MHTTQYECGDEVWVAHHNSDLSMVRFCRIKPKGGAEVEIPGEVIKDVVACWVMSQKVARLENMGADEILLS